MDIEIRKLTPDIAEDYVNFFGVTPHNQKWQVKCYCVFWNNDDGKSHFFGQNVKQQFFSSNFII